MRSRVPRVVTVRPRVPGRPVLVQTADAARAAAASVRTATELRITADIMMRMPCNVHHHSDMMITCRERRCGSRTMP